jgi:hypothetical protein
MSTPTTLTRARMPDAPTSLRVIGVPEEGGHCRVWALEGDAVLGLMRLAWFRFAGGSQEAAEAAAVLPAAATGITTQMYK